MKEIKPSKLKLSKQTVATLDTKQLYAVRAGNVRDADSSPVCITIGLSFLASCFNCN
jgi:hypothetical protein